MNNKGLVTFASMALSEKWGYVWGTFGQKLTESLFAQKLQQYPVGVGQYKDFIRQHWMNRRVTDCVGLIKGFYWTVNGTLKYDGNTDVSANEMFNRAKEKGSIGTLPEIPGLCLWKSGHIGVYIGNGQVIESRGTKYGVIKSSVIGSGSAGWTHWLKCPYIEYTDSTPSTPKTITTSSATWEYYITGDLAKELQMALNAAGLRDRYGNVLVVDGYLGDRSIEAMEKVFIKAYAKGDLVRVIQKRLISLEIPLLRYGADGEMSVGGETENGVKAYQAYRDLEIDGIVGAITMKEMFMK